MLRVRAGVAFLAACFLLWLPAVPGLAREDGVLVLGRVSDNPREHYNQLQPLLEYVVARMRSVGIREGRILMARDAQQMATYLRRGQVDWVTETAGTGVWLEARTGARILLTTARGGKPDYTSVFFVRHDSPLRSLAELPGRSIAFQRLSSTSAYYMPAHELLGLGLRLENQFSPRTRPAGNHVGYVFARSERNIATWVSKGVVDAGVMGDSDWVETARMPSAWRAQMRVIHTTQPVPRGVELVNGQMPDAVRQRLQAVLLEASRDPQAAPALRAFFATSQFLAPNEQSERQLQQVREAVRQVTQELE